MTIHELQDNLANRSVRFALELHAMSDTPLLRMWTTASSLYLALKRWGSATDWLLHGGAVHYTFVATRMMNLRHQLALSISTSCILETHCVTREERAANLVVVMAAWRTLRDPRMSLHIVEDWSEFPLECAWLLQAWLARDLELKYNPHKERLLPMVTEWLLQILEVPLPRDPEAPKMGKSMMVLVACKIANLLVRSPHEETGVQLLARMQAAYPHADHIRTQPLMPDAIEAWSQLVYTHGIPRSAESDP